MSFTFWATRPVPQWYSLHAPTYRSPISDNPIWQWWRSDRGAYRWPPPAGTHRHGPLRQSLWHCAITCAEASSLVAPLALKPTRPSTNTPVPTATEMSAESSIAPPGSPAQAVLVETPTAITAAATSGATKRVLRIPRLLDEVPKIVIPERMSNGIRVAILAS